MLDQPKLRLINADQAAREAGNLFRLGKANYLEALKAMHKCGGILRKKQEDLVDKKGAWKLWLRDNEDVLGFGWRKAYRLIEFNSQMSLSDLNNLDTIAIAGIRQKLYGKNTENLSLATTSSVDIIEENDLETEAEEAAIGQQNLRNLLLNNAMVSAHFGARPYHGPIDRKIIKACRRAAQAWNDLADNLERSISND